MNNWLRKAFVVMISILTFGLVTPTQFTPNVNAENPIENDVFQTADFTSLDHQASFREESRFDKGTFLEDLVKQAEIQSYQKFGTKIKPVIEGEFREIILPNIEKALEEMAHQFPDEDLQNVSVTEQPGKGYSEKIFHVKNSITGMDILRFHVRRDHPPQAGYWFNFHYHTYHDQFQSHHELGTIYWAKDTPPKWMC